MPARLSPEIQFSSLREHMLIHSYSGFGIIIIRRVKYQNLKAKHLYLVQIANSPVFLFMESDQAVRIISQGAWTHRSGGKGWAQQSHISRNLGCNLQNERYRKQLIWTGICWPQESTTWWFWQFDNTLLKTTWEVGSECDADWKTKGVSRRLSCVAQDKQDQCHKTAGRGVVHCCFSGENLGKQWRI